MAGPERVPGARETPLSTGLVARAAQAVKYVLSGVAPDNWFGPFQPLPPMAPDDAKGRRWDYQTGRNIQYVPRSDAQIGFAELRALANNCDVLRGVIEARKDQIAALDWVIRPRQSEIGSKAVLWAGKQSKNQVDAIPQETRDKIVAITKWFEYPDRELTWDQWMRSWLEDMLVIDAATFWRRRTRAGNKLYSLEQMDGATIFPVTDYSGRRPTGADVAYQQINHGIVAADFTNDELMYLVRNVRVNTVYGYSNVEQVLMTVNTAIRRSLFQLEYYREGSQPDSFVGLPKEWNLSQIKDFQSYMDSLLVGNLATRRHVRFMPGEFKYQETKEPPLKDMYDEWLARIICFVFSIAPEPFVQHMNRATAQTSHSRALEEGLAPTQRYIKKAIDRVLAEDFGAPDLEFSYLEDREQDPQTQMQIDVGYVESGIKSIDEVRQARGLDPLGGAASVPMLRTPSGYIPLGAVTGVAANGAGTVSPNGGQDGATSTVVEAPGLKTSAPHSDKPGERPPPRAMSEQSPTVG